MNVNAIKAGNYECLLEMNINPVGKSIAELIRYFTIATLIHSTSACISQFKEGIESISQCILSKNNISSVQPLLQYSNINYCFDQIINLISSRQFVNKEYETGSNQADLIERCIAEFELFLVNLGCGKIIADGKTLDYCDLILFITGCDRVPTYGFEKKLEVIFENVSLPTASTCGLIMRVPNTPDTMQKKLITALVFGGGFGSV